MALEWVDANEGCATEWLERGDPDDVDEILGSPGVEDGLRITTLDGDGIVLFGTLRQIREALMNMVRTVDLEMGKVK